MLYVGSRGLAVNPVRNIIGNNNVINKEFYVFLLEFTLYKIYFMQPNIETATRPAITTTSLKKVVKLLESENFKLTDLK